MCDTIRTGGTRSNSLETRGYARGMRIYSGLEIPDVGAEGIVVLDSKMILLRQMLLHNMHQ